MNRVVHFEIHAQDMGRAQKFYEEVFGWKFMGMGTEFGNYRVIMTGPGPDEMIKGGLKMNELGINGGMTMRQGPPPAENAPIFGYVCIVGVENIDETIQKIEVAGGTLALAKMSVPNVGLLAYYKDTEGNIFGVLQPDPQMTKK